MNGTVLCWNGREGRGKGGRISVFDFGPTRVVMMARGVGKGKVHCGLV